MNSHELPAAELSVLALGLRRDLVISDQWFTGRKCWVVKDPVSLAYFRFGAQEIAILRMLDGRAGLAEIKARFDEKFAPRQITIARILAFVASLHRNGLLLSNVPGQGEQLLLRHRRARYQTWLTTWTGILAIRFRGIDPDPLLAWLQPRCRFLFSSWSLATCMLLMATALTLAGVYWQDLQSRLPSLTTFVSPSNLIWLVIVLAIIKILHELGHALTCKALGGECHEMGLLLLVFTPCLYCDVSDSWMLDSRWKRMAITAAGIWVELVLASICTMLWWYSQPGLFNSICLNVMLICTVGTVLINGNPLLRYDGYYLLSDVLDIPNLWQDSRMAVRQHLAHWMLGLVPPQDAIGKQQGWLLLYGAASMVYRSIVLVMILLLVHRTLQPLGLQAIAQVVTVIVLAGVIIGATSQFGALLMNPQIRSRLKPIRVIASSFGFLAVMGCIFLVPLPCRIRVPALVQPRNSQPVYVTVAGTLVHSVRLGEHVQAQQEVARLENLELEREVAELRGQLERQRIRVRNLESLRLMHSTAGSRLPSAKQLLTHLEQMLREKQKQQRTLTLTAPRAGKVWPSSSVPVAEPSFRELPGWVGSPLDPRNRSCWLERSTELCLVGDSARFEALLFVDQSDIPLVRTGQLVRVRLDMARGHVLTGTVHEISRQELQAVPEPLAAGQELAHEMVDGVARPVSPSYQVRVFLDSTDLPLLLDSHGQAKIRVDGQTMARRMYRFVARTFWLTQ